MYTRIPYPISHLPSFNFAFVVLNHVRFHVHIHTHTHIHTPLKPSHYSLPSSIPVPVPGLLPTGLLAPTLTALCLANPALLIPPP
jgi:hypothetical protein